MTFRENTLLTIANRSNHGRQTSLERDQRSIRQNPLLLLVSPKKIKTMVKSLNRLLSNSTTLRTLSSVQRPLVIEMVEDSFFIVTLEYTSRCVNGYAREVVDDRNERLSMIGRFGRHRRCRPRYFFLANGLCIISLLSVLFINRVALRSGSRPAIKPAVISERELILQKPVSELIALSPYTYDDFIQWNRSLCSARSDDRGPHQKVITLSIYGTTSKYTDNPMFTWNQSIIPFLEPLVVEVKELLPTWVIRIYTDFAGSTKAQRDLLFSFDNIDVCNVTNLPMFGSTMLTYLPGKMWRFLPVFDPLVDYTLSRDLDSPITRRETETLEMWLADEHQRFIFHVLRDNKEHGIPILGGLWGAAIGRARQHLFDTFVPVLIPSIAGRYNGTGDQLFLSDFVWRRVKTKTLAFDSYTCQQFGGRPYPSERPRRTCYIGCIRMCCTNTTAEDGNRPIDSCPKACRPKNHPEWIYC